MSKEKGFKAVPFTFNRRMASISASVANAKNTIHGVTEVDISKPRHILRQYRETTGESLSFTAYIVYCLARTVAANPLVNSFRKRNKLILLEHVSISTLVERTLNGEKIPEPFGIQRAEEKSYRQIHDEIRAAQQNTEDKLGSLSGMTCVRFIPDFLMKSFFRIASKNIAMQKRYGVISVTALGMFSRNATWFIPLGGATVLLTIGGIIEKPVTVDGKVESREYLCLTVSFDHNIVDGAPAARFTRQLTDFINNGDGLTEELNIS
jgi:pyruvate/2-oxoglutarate dehydrogenase complex dihydrolipoamide acyltransferase (E2) component